MPSIPYFTCLLNACLFQCKPSPSLSGTVKFGDTADNCTQSIAGTVRYSTSQNALEVCNSSAWLLLVTAGMDETVVTPARDCLDILKSGAYILTITYHNHEHQCNMVDSLFLRDVVKF